MTTEQMVMEIIQKGCTIEIWENPRKKTVEVKVYDTYPSDAQFGRGDTLENAVLGAYLDWKAEAQ